MRILAVETLNHIGEKVLLKGWVATRRDHGKISFIDLRDRSGIVQVVVNKERVDVKTEYVIEVEGLVKVRPESMVNTKIPTGTVEVEAEKVKILGKSKELPFPLDTDGYKIEEELRLKYRYLDLRRDRLANNIRLRSKLIQYVREFLFSRDFTEIETPLLSKSTPEGSRDFLVPSRLQPGKFYALPQSPQQYKQLLMVAGFEKYFQIARALRDEDLRADRGFEHSQIDLEMSFVTREDVMNILEDMITTVVEKLGMIIKEKPFPVFTYKEAMEKFGADKFDLRNDEEKKQGIKAFAWVTKFPFFEKDKEGNWTFTHNPFSAPEPEFEDDLLNKKNIGNILTSQYDLVCNGYEVGGGSIRANKKEILEAVFEVMGYPKEKIQNQFGHMLEAFEYGAPPHGGCAFGIERLMMILTGETALREVVAFPQTSGGKTAVMDAPSIVSDLQLKELGIKVVGDTRNAFQKIKDLLEKNKIQYKVVEHEAVFTSEEAAKVRGTSLHQGAKALVLYGDDKAVMAVLAADKKVDFKLIKSLYGIKDLRMATPGEVKEVTGGVEIGAVPPFGNIFNIPLYADESLFTNEKIDFNAGLHTTSIEMKAEDYKTAALPTVGNFSK